MSRSTLFAPAMLALYLAMPNGARLDRRIVDRVIIGDPRSEREHAYAADGGTAGTVDGRAFRQATRWMRFALTIFDDTEVTIACTFLGAEGTGATFDVIAENRVVATYTFDAAQRTTAEFRVPIELTRGRTNIGVTLRPTAGGATPRLVEVRSIQDHNE